MDAKVFINYRREDTAPHAGRLYDRLTAHFGEDQVFIDIDQIEPGEDFVEAINRKVGTCDVAIVAMGPDWLHATDASGKRRLDDEEDFVRMEIVAALQRKIRVIPVLVGGAQMPRKQDLPEALAPLSRRNAIELSETRFHADVNRLIEAIEKSFALVEKKTELSTKPLAPSAEPASVRPSHSKDRMTPVKSTQTNPAIPPVVPSSFIAALKQPAVWIKKHLIVVTTIGATVILLLLAILALFARPHPSIRHKVNHYQTAANQGNQNATANLTSLSKPVEPNKDVPSTDIDKPTLLTSNEIRGFGVGQHVSYYYAFKAGPGEVKVTMDGKNLPGGITNAIGVEISDLDAKTLLNMNLGNTTIAKRKVERFQLGQQQEVILRILLDDRSLDYMVRLDGPVDFNAQRSH